MRNEFILKQDGEEVARGDEQEILKFMYKTLGLSPQTCAITSVGMKSLISDPNIYKPSRGKDVSAPFSIELTLETWLKKNSDTIREITSARQKGTRLFVVEPGEAEGKEGRIVYFGRFKDGVRDPRQMPISYLKADGQSIRWPLNISKGKKISDDAGHIRWLEFHRAKWGKA